MSMTDVQITDAIRSAIGEIVGATLDPAQDATPLNSLYERYDSLAVIDSVVRIEEALNVSVDLVQDDLRSTFASISAIERLVRGKLADQAVLGSGF
jgi:hypothetical protein